MSFESSKYGQNPYIWGPRLEKEAELLAPSGGSVLHFGTIEGAQPLRSPNNALKIDKNRVFLSILVVPYTEFLNSSFFSSTQDLISFVTKKEVLNSQIGDQIILDSQI